MTCTFVLALSERLLLLGTANRFGGKEETSEFGAITALDCRPTQIILSIPGSSHLSTFTTANQQHLIEKYSSWGCCAPPRRPVE